MDPVKRISYSQDGTYEERVDLIDYEMLELYICDRKLFHDITHGKRKFPKSKESLFKEALCFCLSDEGEDPSEMEKPRNDSEERMVKLITQNGLSEEEAFRLSHPQSKSFLSNDKQLAELLTRLSPYIKLLKSTPTIKEEEKDNIALCETGFRCHEQIQLLWGCDENAFSNLEIRFSHPCGLGCKEKIDRLVVDYNHETATIFLLCVGNKSPRDFYQEVKHGSFILLHLAFVALGFQLTYSCKWKCNYHIIYFGKDTGNASLFEVEWQFFQSYILEVENYLRNILVFQKKNNQSYIRDKADYVIGEESKGDITESPGSVIKYYANWS